MKPAKITHACVTHPTLEEDETQLPVALRVAIPLTGPVLRDVDRLLKLGMYGFDRVDVCERLFLESLRKALVERGYR
jgi:hypothetical protein